jgi:hypothetical protein
LDAERIRPSWIAIQMPHDRDVIQTFEHGTRLQLESADLLRRTAELRRRTAHARERFEAARQRLLETRKRLELIR